MLYPTPAPDALAEESDLVVLLAEDGTTTGTAPRDQVHGADTPLHLAFSTYLFDPAGRLLLTRRALTKRTWPGVWSNSCCGHPKPGEAVVEAAGRRVREELGAEPRDLALAVPDFRYRAVDASGIVEHEICPVFVGKVDPAELSPDADEIAETTWVPWEAVVTAARATPMLLSPWAVRQIPLVAQLESSLWGGDRPHAQGGLSA